VQYATRKSRGSQSSKIGLVDWTNLVVLICCSFSGPTPWILVSVLFLDYFGRS
jgi:hypothetical protein